MIYIGIDPGVKTGVAVWDNRQRTFLQIETVKIHRAMELVRLYKHKAADVGTKLIVRVEDARQRKWFERKYDKKGEEENVLQGAGSIKRDSKIWDDYLSDMGVEYQMVAPKGGMTKYTKERFQALTGWKKPTNEHNRDAAMLVFGF